MQSASGRTYFAFIAFMSLLLDDDFLPVHDVEAAWQVGCAGLLHEAAVDGVDLGRCVGVSRSLADSRHKRAVEGKADGAVGRGLRHGQVGLATFVGEGCAVLCTPVEAEVLVVLVVREHVEQAVVAHGRSVFDRAFQQVVGGSGGVGRSYVVAVVAGFSFQQDACRCGDDGSGRVAVVDGKAAVYDIGGHGCFHALGHDDGVLAEQGGIACVGHVERSLFIERGQDTAVLGVAIAAEGRVRRAVLDVLPGGYVLNYERAVGLLCDAPHGVRSGFLSGVQRRVVIIVHVEVAAVRLLDGEASFDSRQGEAVQVGRCHDVGRRQVVDIEVVVAVALAYGLGHVACAVDVGRQDVLLAGRHGGGFPELAQGGHSEGVFGCGFGVRVGFCHRSGDCRRALADEADEAVFIHGCHVGVRARVGHCAVARARQFGSHKGVRAEQVGRHFRLGKADRRGCLAAYLFVEHGEQAASVGIGAERAVVRIVLHKLVLGHIGDDECAVGLRLDGPYISFTWGVVCVEAVVVILHIEVSSVSLLDVVAAVDSRNREGVVEVVHDDGAVVVHMGRINQFKVAVVARNRSGDVQVSAFVLRSDDEVALAARDGRGFLESRHRGQVGDGQRVAGRSCGVGVRFRRRGGDGRLSGCHEAHCARRGVDSGHFGVRAGERSGGVGGFGERGRREGLAQVGAERVAALERKSGALLTARRLGDGHFSDEEACFARLYSAERNLRRGGRSGDVERAVCPFVTRSGANCHLGCRQRTFGNADLQSLLVASPCVGLERQDGVAAETECRGS